MTVREPILGIVELDIPDNECILDLGDDRSDASDQGPVAPLLFWNGDFWKRPFKQMVAKKAYSGSQVLVPETVNGQVGDGTRGTVEAARQLDGKTDLIIGACGYFVATKDALIGQTETPVITSGLEFLELALKMTKNPVGIITWSDDALKKLYADKPYLNRLRFVNVGEIPEWNGKMHFRLLNSDLPESDDNKEALHMSAHSKARMGETFRLRLQEAFSPGGAFADIRIIVIECAAVPEFRDVIRSVTPLPVLDVAYIAKASLM